MRRISIHRSLHRADLIMGIERDLLFPIGIAAGVLIVSSGNRPWQILIGLIILSAGFTLARKANKKEPILSKVFRQHIRHKKFYPAKDSPELSHKSIHYDAMSRKEKGLQSLLQYAVMADNGVILCKNGSFLVGYEITTRDTDSSTDTELENFSTSISASLKNLGDGFTLHFDCIRSPEDYYPDKNENHFPDKITRAIDDERRIYFKKGTHFRTTHYLFITWKPDISAQKMDSFLYTEEKDEHQRKKGDDPGVKALKTFQNNLVEIEDRLSLSFRLQKLKDTFSQNCIYSELLEIINFIVTGERHKIKLPKIPMYLDYLLSSQDVTGGIVPKIADKYISVVAIDGFPAESYPMMLSGLDSLSIPYRFNTRYICMDQWTALQQIENYRKGWSQKIIGFFDKLLNNAKAKPNKDAALMAEDAEEAYLINQSGFVGFGYFSGNIILLNEDKELLLTQTRDIRKVVLSQGFAARVETLNALEGWLGTHPANNYSNLRRIILHSLNLADILPLSTIYAGSAAAPCPFYPPGSPPLMYAATDGATPFRLNLHIGDLGHTLIFGPTGAGKSVLLAMIAAQFRRYKNACIFAFDKGLSMFPLVSAAGGTHYHIAGDDSRLAFCPLKYIDTDAEQAWAEDWITTLAKLQKVDIKPEHRTAIHDAVTQIRNSPDQHRTLSNLYHYIQHQELKEAIQHYTNQGAMGKLLDAPADSMTLEKYTVFEIEELMNLGEENLIPVLLYIFHRIEKAFKGQPSILILDEAWIMLGHPVFQQKIREWLKVLRKANCAVVLATQSLSDARNSGLLDVLSESCPSKIFLPNQDAGKDTQKGLYQGLGLNSTQVQIIAQARPKREYYVTSSLGCRLINLSLSPLALSFAGVSGKEDIAAIKNLINEYGPEWPKQWLRARNIEISKV
ncbi:VirB3 family type IV secretion system protein [uncultured Desulfobacter sp.]|uniref:VirB4 family type IV secretion/conjugal transfer ATPase n=1 Tax=uncultured Desulfobacter sp. TaxID=240139 RepID=UPI0029F4CC46|nr:VirB3 family type IV secretion system protein [uncultured Desulfobacter sp.]